MTMISKMIIGLIAAVLSAAGAYLYKYNGSAATTAKPDTLPALVITTTTTNTTPGTTL